MRSAPRRAIECAALLSAILAADVASAIRAEEPPAAHAARLQGTAILARNRPVIGAAVVVVPESPDGEIVVSSTDSKGTFRIENVPDGKYTVTFQRAGLQAVTKDHVELKAPFRPIVEVTMQPALPGPPTPPVPTTGDLSVIGLATDRAGATVSDLKVRLYRDGGDADPIERLSGANGEYEIKGLAEGDWILEAKGLAYLPVRATIPLKQADSRVRLVLVPQPATFDPIPLDLLPPEEPLPPPEPPPVPAEPGPGTNQGAESRGLTAK